MDKLKFDETKPGTPQPVPEDVIVTIENISTAINKFVSQQDTDFKTAWRHGGLIGKDVASSHKKILENIMYLILDDIKEYAETEEHANFIYEQVILSIRHMINIFTTTGMDVTDSKRIVIKLLGYIFSLHLMQRET